MRYRSLRWLILIGGFHKSRTVLGGFRTMDRHGRDGSQSTGDSESAVVQRIIEGHTLVNNDDLNTSWIHNH
jgi:hypothetical protein